MGAQWCHGCEIVTYNKIVSIRNRRRKKSISLTRIYSNRSITEQGFSFLELMISVFIIAVLIAVFIPNINSMQGKGHQRNVQLTASNLQLAVNLTHSLWMTKGIKKSQSLLKIDGDQPLLMNQLGWPIDVLAIDALGTDALGINALDTDASSPEGLEKEVSGKEKNNTQLGLNSASCKRLWIALLKDSAPTVGLEVELDSKKASHRDSHYSAQLENGICRYRYRLNQDGLRIHYDLATGQVITLF
jgi:prepilin-type N-terminal cleavage/methylation domain-containing protein